VRSGGQPTFITEGRLSQAFSDRGVVLLCVLPEPRVRWWIGCATGRPPSWTVRMPFCVEAPGSCPEGSDSREVLQGRPGRAHRPGPCSDSVTAPEPEFAPEVFHLLQEAKEESDGGGIQPAHAVEVIHPPEGQQSLVIEEPASQFGVVNR